MKWACVVLVLGLSFGTGSATRAKAKSEVADEYPDSQDDKVDDDGGEASLGDMELKAEAAHAQIEKLHSRMASAEATHSNVQDELESTDSDIGSKDVATKQEEPADSADVAEIPTVNAVSEPSSKSSEESSEQPQPEQQQDDDVQRLESSESAAPTDKTDLMATASETSVSSQAAGGSEDGFDATEKSLVMFHKRYAVERKETKHLRQELVKANEWGKGLQKRLRGNLKSFNEKTRQTQVFMAHKAKEQAAALEAEKKREHVLESLFAKANRTLSQRAQQLTSVETELNAARKERATLSASALHALRAERKQEAKLQGELTKSKSSVKDLKSKLEHTNGELSVARTEWRAEEMRLLKAEKQEHASNARLEGNLTKIADQVRTVKAAKLNEDRVLTSFKAKSQQVLKEAQAKLTAARGRELTLRKALDKDHKKREHDETTLQKELAVWKKRADNAQASAQQLSREVKLRASGDREEMAELKHKLESETKEATHLEKERSSLDADLQSNFSRVSKLEQEVSQLRQQLKDGEAARKKAEATARRAQEETAQAQAVAKQLSGTVPRLLEQAELAHERRDAISAIKDSQDTAQIDSAKDASVSHKNGTANATADELSQLPSEDLAAAVEQAAVTEDDDKQASQNGTIADASVDAVSTDVTADEAIPAEVPDTDASQSADAVVQKLQDEVESGPKPHQDAAKSSLDGDSAGLSQLLDED